MNIKNLFLAIGLVLGMAAIMVVYIVMHTLSCGSFIILVVVLIILVKITYDGLQGL